MKTLLNKSVFAVGVLIATSSFISCDKTSEATKPIAETSTSLINKKTTEITLRKPIAFITGYDKENEHFYDSARAYFKEKKIDIIEGQYSLEEIISWMNNNATQNPYGEVHIVNKSNPYKGMNLETVVNGEKVTVKNLRKNIIEGNLPSLKNVITNNSKIIFHASGLIDNKELVSTLKDVFSAEQSAKVITSPYYTIFGGKFSNHYLAKPYYVFYPTAHSPGKTDLSKEIAKKYPEEKDINWYDALNNEEERYVGEAYTIQFNIPIKWEFDYHNSDNEIPNFTNQEEIMDWIDLNEELSTEVAKYNIPLEKFRWNWSVKNSKLTIKGKTSVLCVLKPLIKPYGDLKYVKPNTSNKRLYAMK